ncbi:Rac/Rho-like_protein [Hexamita inflata]|uniref:Rac/Rho-like protein n=1 Tax=Hexamita inflata TaxID=28002 RepID=A0AA86V3C6_9EUKA|nr:Rac/Rho-like protein [Hexamita inflata]CAI9978849.1 Rac/Rho-like protein [Hexamita inflata]
MVFVGDMMVGKTRFIKFINEIPYDYIPCVFDNYNLEYTIDNQKVICIFWNTACAEDYDRIRPLSYPNTNVFVLCYALNNPESLQNIYSKWLPEIKAHTQVDIPFIILGMKSDLEYSHEIVNEALKIQMKTKAKDNLVCSTETNYNIRLTMDRALRVALEHYEETSK